MMQNKVNSFHMFYAICTCMYKAEFSRDLNRFDIGNIKNLMPY